MTDWSMGKARAVDAATPRYACPEDVFVHEYERLVKALTIIAGEKEAAADAVQEAFVRLVCRWDRVSSYDDPAGWVRRVALNKIRDQQRSLWRHAGLLLRIREECAAPEKALEADRELWVCLRRLPVSSGPPGGVPPEAAPDSPVGPGGAAGV